MMITIIIIISMEIIIIIVIIIIIIIIMYLGILDSVSRGILEPKASSFPYSEPWLAGFP